ncbi:MAG: NYN domain-containing protein [Hormoscilla sp. SP5CHS1]|nr:NYN domain-containing protein [Hormoscilla sp. SP5CHS1]
MGRALPKAVVLVDGYNVIGAWTSLQKTLARHGLQAAREHLVEVLTNYSAWQGFETLLVFDAHYQNTPKTREVVMENLSVHYTEFGQTADSYIEITCAKFRDDVRKYRQRIIVVTSDQVQQVTVVGYGAECISATQLASEVASMTSRVGQHQLPAKKSSSRFMVKSLDPSTQARLAQLRMGLK